MVSAAALAFAPLGGAAGPAAISGPATHFVFSQRADGSNALNGIAIAPNGDLLIVYRSVLRVDHAGRIGVFSGVTDVQALTVDPAGNVYFNTALNVRKVAPSGATSSFDSVHGVSLDGTLGAVDAAGDYYLTSEDGSGDVWEITPKGGYRSLHKGGDNGDSWIALDKAGDLFIDDPGDNGIVERTAAGNVRVLGKGLQDLGGMVVEPSGALDVTQPYSYVVRRISRSGRVTTIAGNGLQGFSGDGGQATKAALDTPTALALDPHGDLYIEDEGSSFDSPVIRKVSPSGRITTVAGSTCSRVKETTTTKPNGIVTAHGTCGQLVRVALAAPVNLHWTCTSCPTGIVLENGSPGVGGETYAQSTAHSGSTYLGAGRQEIRVTAGGSWSLTFTPAPAPKEVGKLVLHGQGMTRIPPIVLAAPARLSWSCPHCLSFGFYGVDGRVLVPDTPGKRGSVNVGKGAFVRLEVVAEGTWTVRIGGAPVQQPTLPAPVFSVPGGGLGPVAAVGSRFALEVAGSDGPCRVYVASLRKATAVPARISGPGVEGCQTGDATVIGLWLGTDEIAALVDDSPSPHGEDFTLWSAPPTAATLRQVGSSWGWTDSDVPPSYGCAEAVVSGGGTVATAQITNSSGLLNGVDGPSCAKQTQTVILLSGASQSKVTVQGVWEPIATDGKQILLAALTADGYRTGQVELVGLDGKAVSAPTLDPAAVKRAGGGWLTPAGVVLDAGSRVVAPKWTVAVDSATVAEGRLIYVKGNALRVRRLADGVDRLLMKLPNNQTFAVAAGSFGVALVGAPESGKIGVYRLPWSTVDAVLTAG